METSDTDKNGLQVFEVPKVTRNALDDVHIGDFYWVKFDDTKWDDDKEENVKVGEHETLMCVDEIGSNYFGFSVFSDRGSTGVRVHFNDFMKKCRPEPNWKSIFNKRMAEIQKAIQDKTQSLVREGQKVSILPDNVSTDQEEKQVSFLPAKVTVDPKKYKKDLIHLRDRVPKIVEDIEELAKDFAVTAKNLALPDIAKLEAVKTALEVVEDRIFTVELYCGILESVAQIAKGDPAPMATPVVIRQQMLFMDEETLFDYREGGMDFKKIGEFDEWVVKPENLNRLLPDQRGIVAFRVRRNGKEYGDARSIGEAWAHIQWAEANKQTYLLIRNGGNVYRIASEVDFSPRLIPKVGEIGNDQFLKIDERYEWSDDGSHTKTIRTETLITPESVKYDDHVKEVDKLLKHYNRIVILIQGLLDRSMVFHPHPPVNLRNQADMEKWVVLMRDEERGLPSNKVNWEEYQKQLNSSLRKDKWVYVDSTYDEGYKDGQTPYRDGSRWREPARRRGWAANRMPDICRVESVKRDGSAVKVTWPWGSLAHGKERWVENPNRPGWGRYEYDTETDRMCHEWIPINRVLNVSDYNLDDYKMFLCDRTLQGEYLKWAQYLLTAEDWARNRKKGIPPEEDKKAQVQR